MRRLWGLRATMAASYVLTTAAAVTVVEVVILGVVVPGLVTSNDSQLVVGSTAVDYAARAGQLYAEVDRLPTAAEFPLGEQDVPVSPGSATVTQRGGVVRVPYVAGSPRLTGPVPVALLVGADGRIAVTSYPDRYPVGAQARDVLPGDVQSLWDGGGFAAINKGATGRDSIPQGDVLWCTVAFRAGGISNVTPPGQGIGQSGPPLPDALPAVGFIYLHVPASATLPAPVGAASFWDEVWQQVSIGLRVLAAAVPVGIVFGLVAPHRLIGRLRRLATSTVAVADGDYQHRVSVSGQDEVAQLEDNFNRMAERLAATVSAERRLASADERARIARELHDSISQALFSMRMLAGGMRKALPENSPLRPHARTLEETATETINEMQALLLELRPVALSDAGLIPALEELGRAYHKRLGVAVHTDLEPVHLSDAAEHAVLRMVQEAMANAVRHGHANRIELSLHTDNGRVMVTVRDDGQGFMPDAANGSHGLGLGLMRERASELGGEFWVESRPGDGTCVRIAIPREEPS